MYSIRFYWKKRQNFCNDWMNHKKINKIKNLYQSKPFVIHDNLRDKIWEKKFPLLFTLSISNLNFDLNCLIFIFCSDRSRSNIIYDSLIDETITTVCYFKSIIFINHHHSIFYLFMSSLFVCLFGHVIENDCTIHTNKQTNINWKKLAKKERNKQNTNYYCSWFLISYVLITAQKFIFSKW